MNGSRRLLMVSGKAIVAEPRIWQEVGIPFGVPRSVIPPPLAIGQTRVLGLGFVVVPRRDWVPTPAANHREVSATLRTRPRRGGVHV